MKSLKEFGFVLLDKTNEVDMKRLAEQRDAALAEVEKLRQEQLARPVKPLKPLGRPRKAAASNVVDLTSLDSKFKLG